MPDGKIPVSNREETRWLRAYNVSSQTIEPYAPCYLVKTFRAPFVPPSDEVFSVVPFPKPGNVTYVHENDNEDATWPDIRRTGGTFPSHSRRTTVVNGPAPIPPEKYGRVTMDWPAVARVNLVGVVDEPTEEDESEPDEVLEDVFGSLPDLGQYSSSTFGVVYVDTIGGDSDTVATQFTDIDSRNLSLGIFGGFRLFKPLAFETLRAADLSRGLYWVAPVQADFDEPLSVFESSIVSQEPVAPVEFHRVLDYRATSVEVHAESGGLTINGPGVYVFDFQLAAQPVNANEVGTAQEIHQYLEIQRESLSEVTFESFTELVRDGVTQVPFLTSIACGGYGECPTMNIRYPFTRGRQLALLVLLKTRWRVGDDPLLRLTFRRLGTFDNEVDYPDLAVRCRVTRSIPIASSFHGFGTGLSRIWWG